jgi:hypothetical protein
MLYVPLSSEGKDFICFLRKGQPRHVHWAGNPNAKNTPGSETMLEPRKSFAIWSETVAGRSRAWTEDQLDTAGILALVYGKVSAMRYLCLEGLVIVMCPVVHRGVETEGERTADNATYEFAPLECIA